MTDSPPIITLLTDFGEADAYVGTMKGVLLSIAPQARLIDLTHQIPPQDIKLAAHTLMTAAPFFPLGTVHLVVVDPGVGSKRRPIAVQTRDACFVAPDNGVLSYTLARSQVITAVELANPAYHLPEVSRTFHGRDIFSPAAAHLAMGVPLSELGPTVDDLTQLDPPRLIVAAGRIEGEVLSVDRFGNIRTSIQTLTWEDGETLSLRPLFAPDDAPSGARIPAAQARVGVGSVSIGGITTSYGSVPPGKALAYVGSAGGLEIAINQGDAARALGVRPGDPVSLRYTPG